MRTILFLLILLLLPLPAHAASGLLGGLAIGGYDPVIYVEHHKAVKGFPQYVAASDFMVYHFRAPQNVELFLENKEKYTPRFGGNCAYEAARGKLIAADPQIWAIEEGKLYLFRTEDSRNAWYANLPEHRKRGEEFWKHYKGETENDTKFH